MSLKQPIAQQLSRYPQLKLGILFGSIGRGQSRPDSDLDLAVAANRPLEVGEKQMLIEELAQLSARPIDLVDLQSAGGLLLQEVLTKGKWIYKTDNGLYAELIKKMLFNAANFMPYRNRIIEARRKAWIGV